MSPFTLITRARFDQIVELVREKFEEKRQTVRVKFERRVVSGDGYVDLIKGVISTLDLTDKEKEAFALFSRDEYGDIAFKAYNACKFPCRYSRTNPLRFSDD